MSAKSPGKGVVPRTNPYRVVAALAAMLLMTLAGSLMLRSRSFRLPALVMCGIAQTMSIANSTI